MFAFMRFEQHLSQGSLEIANTTSATEFYVVLQVALFVARVVV